MHYNPSTLFAHWFRRFFHLSLLFIPIFYYGLLNYYPNLPYVLIINIIVILILSFEIIRLRRGWLLWGQREYERKQISAFAWGAFSISMVLLLAPKVGIWNAAYGIPIIASLAIVDPIIGEMRRYRVNNIVVIVVALLLTTVIWTLSAFFLATPLHILPWIIPITVAAETLKFQWIDDNATMLLIPLMVVLLFQYL